MPISASWKRGGSGEERASGTGGLGWPPPTCGLSDTWVVLVFALWSPQPLASSAQQGGCCISSLQAFPPPSLTLPAYLPRHSWSFSDLSLISLAEPSHDSSAPQVRGKFLSVVHKCSLIGSYQPPPSHLSPVTPTPDITYRVYHSHPIAPQSLNTSSLHF